MVAVQAEQLGKAGLWDERMAKLAAMRDMAYQNYVKTVDDAKWALDWTLSFLDEEHVGLELMRDDTAVLVRNSQGAAVTKYHWAGHPCGHVTGKGRRFSSFDQILEGEARRRSLRRCGACPWPSSVSVSEQS